MYNSHWFFPGVCGQHTRSPSVRFLYLTGILRRTGILAWRFCRAGQRAITNPEHHEDGIWARKRQFFSHFHRFPRFYRVLPSSPTRFLLFPEAILSCLLGLLRKKLRNPPAAKDSRVIYLCSHTNNCLDPAHDRVYARVKSVGGGHVVLP
jgi:hypothetical protein